MTNNLLRFLTYTLVVYSLFPIALPEPIVSSILNFLAPDYAEKQIPILASFTIWNYTHRIGCALLALLGLHQLKGFSKYHRVIGYAYAVLALISAVGGIYMVFTSPYNTNEVLPILVFASLLVIFIVCGIINSKNLKVHKKWMRRSFSIVLGPLIIRIVYMIFALFMSEHEVMVPSFWIGWITSLIGCEIIFFWNE